MQSSDPQGVDKSLFRKIGIGEYGVGEFSDRGKGLSHYIIVVTDEIQVFLGKKVRGNGRESPEHHRLAAVKTYRSQGDILHSLQCP